MESNQLKSVVSLVDSLVRSAHDRRSHILCSNKSPTDFSICSILGLESDVNQSSSSSEYNSNTSPPLSPYSDCTSPRPSLRVTSPPLTPYSDITSSSSDCGSEHDQASTPTEQSAKKKRQRTTFSPTEFWELERAFRRRPYLLKEDEEELVQRLGITAKSLKYWFQNRRAKSKKLERKMSSIRQTCPSNQFEVPVSKATPSRRLQFMNRSPSDHWKLGKRVSCVAAKSFLEDKNRAVGHHLSVKSNQFRGDRSFFVPMLHPDQFWIKPFEPARLPYSRPLHRYEPY